MKAKAPQVERVEIDVHDAAARLPELSAYPTDHPREVTLTRGGQAKARFTLPAGTVDPRDIVYHDIEDVWDDPIFYDGLEEVSGPPAFGTAAGQFEVPDDFDDPIDFGACGTRESADV